MQLLIICRLTVSERIQHPFCLDEKLYFFADVPHLLKNLRSAFLNLNISLPASLVAKSNLPSHQVKHDSLSPNNKFCERN